MVKYGISFGVLLLVAAVCAYATLFFAWVATVTKDGPTREHASALYSVWEAGLWMCTLAVVIVARRIASRWWVTWVSGPPQGS